MKLFFLTLFLVVSLFGNSKSQDDVNKTADASGNGTVGPKPDQVDINNSTEDVPELSTIEVTSEPTTTILPITTTNATAPTSPHTTSKPTTTPATPSNGSSTEPTQKPKPLTSPSPLTTPKPHKDRHFDGPSFIGGIISATGLMAIGFVAFKFYKARTERNYHTL